MNLADTITRPKVFGIGFHKTGTKSLGQALRVLGYRVAGPIGTRAEDISSTALERALKAVQAFDAFQDNPFPVLYRDLDRMFPGSKFILTHSPEDLWLRRAVRYFGKQSTPMRQWIYGAGSPVGNETSYLLRYRRHNMDVMEYFRDRPKDFLSFALTECPDWKPLCDFLGHKAPLVPFPHENRSA